VSTGDRYVLLGAARPRMDWFRSVSRWATTAALPAEFVKCVSAVEVAARLGSGRAFSGVILDGGLAGVDRDLLDQARDAGCAVVIIDDGRRTADWLAAGASAVLPHALDRGMLLDALATHARTVTRAEHTSPSLADEVSEVPWAGRLAAVCGSGGTGASTLAAALAQGLAAPGHWGRPVVLADLCRHADQAMIHDVGDIAPGIQELVDAHRLRALPPAEVQALTYDPPARPYSLLLGLRRAHHWSAVRPRAFEAALESLRCAFPVTVCDLDADLEGEDEGGSVDVEDRNAMTRLTVGRASVVFVVGRRGTTGLHGLVRVVADLVAFGVQPERIQPVVNMAPRSPRERAATAAAVADLLQPVAGRALASPVFTPVRRVDDSVRDAVGLPSPLPAVMAGAFGAVVRRDEARMRPVRAERGLVRVAPGSLGSWTEDVG
jgi:Mrp family chromosome partitioning ATPase